MTNKEAIKRRYTFGNDEFNLEAAYHDCKLVFDGITDDDSFQEADTGLILYYANEIIYALHEALEGKDTNVPSNDTISRQQAIDALDKHIDTFDAIDKNYLSGLRTAMSILKEMPSAQPEQRWIPFKTRPLTEEEKEEHPEWDCILDCKLPDDGQQILVSVSVRGHERVQYDEFYTDDGCYLDSEYEIGTEAVAWMPLPEPYREERTEE